MKKKIILVLNEAPLSFAGAASRWYFILCNELYKSNYEIDLFAACAKPDHLVELQTIFPQGHFYLYPKRSGFFKKIQTILKPFSYTISEQMKQDIQNSINRGVDVIHIEQTFSSWALENINDKCLLSIHYLSNIDLAQPPFISMKEFIILKLLKRTEKKMISKFLHVKSCSERIEKVVKNWYPNKNYYHFPFGIDAENYHYLENSNRIKSDTITLIASMGWYPGKSAAINLLNNIWPSLKKKNPRMKLRIVGWNAREVLNEYLSFSDVEILENVPDIKKYFYESAFLIYIPVSGSGVKIKVQEAMLLGTPVITNSDGIEGLAAVNGVHALVSKSNEEGIELADTLFNDFELQERIRKNARELIVNSCNGKKIVEQITDIYSKIIATSK